MGYLTGKRVLITGGASGIGRATAHQFAKGGCDLVLTDINAQALDNVKAELSRFNVDVRCYCYDVSKRKQVEAMVAEVGDIDVLINNAGIGHTGELVDTSLALWKKLIDVNLYGTLYHVYAFLPQMRARKQGHIVNVSSGQAFFRLPTWGAYAAVKAALAVFSEVLHYELRHEGIRVTTVYPFMVNTPFYKNIEGESWGARLSMKLVPYYSMSPERVGRIIYKAVKKRVKVETVSVINDVGFYSNFVPGLAGVIARVSYLFLGKHGEA